jgi:drug/metabolite transporter (DMT)-like permease
MHALMSRPRLLLALCALFWAGNFVLARAMHEAIPPFALAFWRWAVACLVVLPFVWRPLRRQWPLLRANLHTMLVLALLGVSGFNTLVYIGLQTTSATNGVLIQSTLPVQILLLNWLLFRVPFRTGELGAILLSMLGVALIISSGRPMSLVEGGWNTGDLWVLGAALIWALYSVLLRWRPHELDSRAFLGFTLLAGTAALLPFFVAETLAGRPLSWGFSEVLAVAYVAVFPSALAYLFWNRGVEAVGPNAAGHFVHLMPVFGVMMAVLFLDENVGWFHAAGAALVAAGLGWKALDRRFGGH